MPRRNTRAYNRRRGSRPFQTDTEVAVSFEALARELVSQGKATKAILTQQPERSNRNGEMA